MILEFMIFLHFAFHLYPSPSAGQALSFILSPFTICLLQFTFFLSSHDPGL